MRSETLLAFARWIADAGLSGEREKDLVQAFCERALMAGLPLSRAVVGIDTLHPVLEGRVYEWRRDAAHTRQSEYTRYDAASDAQKWLRSPFFALIQTGDMSLRRRLASSYEHGEFPVLDELKAQGTTDYLAVVNRFGSGGTIGPVDCVFSSWATNAPAGFSDEDLAALDFLVPCLALAIKSTSVAGIAATLMETYLGRDAGRRVLRGHIERGVPEQISAVLWFSDLQEFTRTAESTTPEQVITLLNDYADAIVSAIRSHGGEVLKFIGDGILAMFSSGAAEKDCQHALDAAEDAKRRVGKLNARRAAQNQPVTHFYLGLHIGEVFYGNIGSVDRLDFTVVGPAVNEASRIVAMCRSLDQTILVSAAFAQVSETCRRRLVSVGRYALRGVSRPQELFTLDPEWQG